jgi:hypothetical protein
MVKKFEEDIQALLRREGLVERAVGFFRFLEAAEFRDRLLHG